MKLIIKNSDNFVWLQTDGEITEANDVYIVDGVSVGISVTENTVVTDAVNCPYFEFIAQAYAYSNGTWSIYNQDLYQSQVDLYNQAQKKKRFTAYTIESDPIFFKSQRGEATNQQWLDAVTAVNTKFKYQE